MGLAMARRLAAGGVDLAVWNRTPQKAAPLAEHGATAQLVQASVGAGRVGEDFAILLDLQAAASGLRLAPEDVQVDDGLAAS